MVLEVVQLLRILSNSVFKVLLRPIVQFEFDKSRLRERLDAQLQIGPDVPDQRSEPLLSNYRDRIALERPELVPEPQGVFHQSNL